MTTDSLQTKTLANSKGASSNAAPRPRLALRIGVTGARTLNAARLDELREKVREVLDLACREIKDLAQQEALAKFYADDARPAAPVMRLLSPLARGTDRLVAKVALDLGYALYAPMPFARDEYEKDFTGIDATKEPDAAPLSADEELKEFNDLLAQAGDDWLALDGDREDKNRAYESVGRFVARHSDVLIAIWDGKPAAGRGGTAEIIEYAVSNGVPVWWIHAVDKDKSPVWIADIQDVRDPRPTGEAPEDQLRWYLKRQILPPGPTPLHCRGPIERFVRLGQTENVSPEVEFYAEQPRPVPGFWRVYDNLMRCASEPLICVRTALKRAYDKLMRRGPERPSAETVLPETSPRPKDRVGAYWFGFYDPADARAGEYAKRYRSSYVWIFILATLALFFGVLANLSHEVVDAIVRAKLSHGPVGEADLTDLYRLEKPAVFFWAFLEFVVLGTISVIAVKALRGDWHRRSIEYRLLAELCRKQQVLGPLGNAVSLGAVRDIVLDSDSQEVQIVGAAAPIGAPDRAAWVAWLFAAYERAAPLPRGDVKEWLPDVLREELLDGLIKTQLQYHQVRRAMARDAGRTFELLGAWSFIAVIAVVVLKLAATYWNWGSFWDLFFVTLAIVLPAVSAAFVGIRSYAELQLLSEQSNHMLDELRERKARVERIDPRRPLAFCDLGAEAHGVAVLMLQDLEGWARLFRGKAIEPGG